MADHVAEQIIAAAKTALTGLTTTGARVFDSRVYPVQDAELPCLLIDQGDDDAETITLGAVMDLERSMELLVVACVKQNTLYRNVANTIRREVEIALAGNQTIGGARFVHPSGMDLELAGEGEKPVARATMRFTVRYYTALNAPDVAL